MEDINTYNRYQEDLEELFSSVEETSTLKFSVAELSSMKRTELVDLCKEYKVKHYGNKAVLIKALLTVKSEVEVIEAVTTMTTVSIDEQGEVIGAKGERI